jgi:DNA-binding PadR family transcriptional regulator
MAERLTPAELTLLGLLAEQPRHGYEIEKTLEERGMREWTDLAFSSIYYLVKKLEKAGLVSAVDDIGRAGDRRRRRTYALTAEGLDVARTGTRAALATVTPVHSAVLIGVANLPLLSSDEALDALRSRAEELTRQVRRLHDHPRARAPAPPFVAAIFDHALAGLRAELDWTHRTITILEGETGGEGRSEDSTQGPVHRTGGPLRGGRRP